MSLATPRWWYLKEGAPARLTRTLLKPVSWFWAWRTAARIARTTPGDAGAPVICIGNLTMGGAGKTPVVREVLARLRAMDVDGHALSRGHGGRLEGPVRVAPQIHTAAEVGDEPLMLSRDGPVWVSRDRLAGARAAAEAGAEAIVMDDGHQNPTIAKVLSLVVVDAETRDNEWPFGDGAVFPAGPMREPLRAGLARADAVVLLLPMGLEEPDPELVEALGETPVLLARVEAAAPPPAGRQVGFGGVGKPWKVERALKAAGCDLVDFAPLPDHARLDDGLLRALARRADAYGAGLVTTEKDWARLPEAWRGRVTAWPVRVRFDQPEVLDDLLRSAVGRPLDYLDGERGLRGF